MAFDKYAWLAQAESAGLHPYVIGFVWSHPHYASDEPGRWKEVSEALAAESGAVPGPVQALVPGGKGAMFADFCDEARGLPDPALCLGGGPGGHPFHVERGMSWRVACVLCVSLVREVVSRWAGPRDVEALCRFLAVNFQPEMQILATHLLAGGHGLDLEGRMPPSLFKAYPVVGMVAQSHCR